MIFRKGVTGEWCMQASHCKKKFFKNTKFLGLLSLENRRLWGDLIEVFKILTDRENVDKNQFFTLSEFSHLRGHSLKLSKPRSTRQVRQNFFSQRVIDTWNKLPSDVISSTSVNMFKNKLDDHWNDVGVKSYWSFISPSTNK